MEKECTYFSSSPIFQEREENKKTNDEYKEDTLFNTWCIDSFFFEMLSEATLNIGTHEKIDFEEDCNLLNYDEGFLELETVTNMDMRRILDHTSVNKDGSVRVVLKKFEEMAVA